MKIDSYWTNLLRSVQVGDQREIVRDGLYTPGNTLSYGQISARGFMVKMIDERLSELKKEGYW